MGGEYRWVWRRRVIEWALAETGLGLGSWGAARVVLRVLGRDPNLSITLVNRTWEHAVALAAHTPSVEVDTLGRVADKMSQFDLVMNCLPGGARGHLDPKLGRAMNGRHGLSISPTDPLLVSLGIVIVQTIRAIETGLRCSLPKGSSVRIVDGSSRQAWNMSTRDHVRRIAGS